MGLAHFWWDGMGCVFSTSLGTGFHAEASETQKTQSAQKKRKNAAAQVVFRIWESQDPCMVIYLHLGAFYGVFSGTCR